MKTNWPQKLSILLLWLVCGLSYAQSPYTKVRLLLQDEDSGKPIQEALLFFDTKTKFPHISNSEGVLSFSDSLFSFYNVEIHHPEYEIAQVSPFSKSEKERIIILQKSKKNTIQDTVRAMKTLDKARTQRLESQRINNRLSADVFRQTVTKISRAGLNIPAISGRYLPAPMDTGIIYLSNVVSSFKKTDAERVQEEVSLKKEWGKIRNLSWRQSADYLFNPFQRFNEFPEISKRGYLSVFDYWGEDVYTITPESTFHRKGRKVYSYTVKPKQSHSPYFSGMFWLDAEHGTLLYIELKLSSDQQIEFVDSLSIRQYYYSFGGESLPLFTEFCYYFDVLRNAGEYRNFQVYANFEYDRKSQLSPAKRKALLVPREDEMDSISYDLPISPTEATIRVKKADSVYYARKEKGEIMDSIHNHYSERPFESFFIKGMELPFYDMRHHTHVYPIWYGSGYNTIEGFYLRLKQVIDFNFEKSDIHNELFLRLGFTDQQMKFRNVSRWNFDYKRPSYLKLDFGSYVFQFNEAEPILPVINTFYTLFLGRNFMKIYRKNYAQLSLTREIFNGLDFTISAEYARRMALFDRTFMAIAPERYHRVTPNNPNRPPIISSSDGFRTHNALTMEVNVGYQFGRRYKMVRGKKQNISSSLPRIYMNYKKGIPELGAITDFDYISGGINVNTSVGNIGRSRFDLSAGGFLNTRNIQFIDFKHFNGLQTIFLQKVQDRWSDIKLFRTLRYYDFSTNQSFIEAHYEHNFGGYLLSKVPYIDRYNLHLVTGFNYLSSEFDTHFLELFFGFDNIAKIGKIEFSGGWDDFRVFRLTMRVGINFDYSFYRDNKRR